MSIRDACRAGILLGLSLATAAGAETSLLSEAQVLDRYGRLDVSAAQLDALIFERDADRVVTRGGPIIRYAGPGCAFTTIQSAVNASSDGDTVRVVSGTYDERVTIQSKELDLIGGFEDCSANSSSGRSIINRGGAGLGMDIFYPAAAADPIRFVNVENFEITEGGGTGFDSGGVIVEGRPGRLAVNFRNVEFSANSRDGVNENGGALRIISSGVNSGSSAMVTIDNDSSFLNNTAAGNGGAIHCESAFDTGSVTLLRTGTTLFFQNEAVNGGAVAVDGCTNVFLYSGGPIALIFPTGGLVNNVAIEDGGGIWVDNGGTVQLRAIEFLDFGDPDEAALMAGNSAGSNGGAASVTGTGSFLRVEDAYTLNNSASLGAAFRAFGEVEVRVGREAGSGACAPVQSGGGVLSRPPCSVIDGNDASFGGGAFALGGEAFAGASRTIIRNNTAGGGLGPIARVRNSNLYEGPLTRLRIESSAIYDNSGGFGLDAVNNAEITVTHSTVADNPIGEFRALTAAGRTATVRVLNSIVDGGTSSLGFAQGDGISTVEFDCVIGSTAPGSTGATLQSAYSQIDPEFVDQAARNYRLSATSPAIDYCDDSNTALFPGLDGNPRGQAWMGPAPTPAPNPGSGLVDLGAFEIPFSITNTDLIMDTLPAGQFDVFVNSGEPVDLTLALTNQGSNPAFGPIEVIDDFTPGAVVNQSWTCVPPPGVTCTPLSGTGDISTTVGNLDPGETVSFLVQADLAQPTQDQNFQYTAIVTESQFNLDTNLGNNTVLLDLSSGLFSDGFE